MGVEMCLTAGIIGCVEVLVSDTSETRANESWEEPEEYANTPAAPSATNAALARNPALERVILLETGSDTSRP